MGAFFEPDDFGAGGHYFAHLAVAEAEHFFQHIGFFGFDGSGFGAGGDEAAYFGFADLLGGAGDAEGAAGQGGERLEQGDGGGQGDADGVEGAGDGEGDFFGGARRWFWAGFRRKAGVRG